MTYVQKIEENVKLIMTVKNVENGIENYVRELLDSVGYTEPLYGKKILEILKDTQYDRIILWRSPFGWNVP